MRKIIIFNVKFSTNVGDGVIAECMEHEIAALSPGTEIVTIDIGGRESFGDSGVIKNGLLKNSVKSVLKYLPKTMTQALKARVSEKAIETRFKPQWTEKVRGADLIVIGGGQLIAASDDYFPPRIQAVCEIAAELRIPFALHAVGMSNPAGFSDNARQIFKRYFENNPLFVGGSVRDADSMKNWCALFPNMQIGLARDPGLTAAVTYCRIFNQAKSLKNTRKGEVKNIAVGVIAPSVMDTHAAQIENGAPFSRQFFTELGCELADAGFNVTYFTNGAAEDQEYLETFSKRDFGNRTVHFAPRPLTPKELAATLAQADCVIAHRMHALIVSYAFGIPTVGLVWDQKLTAFYESINAGDHALSGALSPKQAVAAVVNAINNPLSPEARDRHEQEARSGLAALLQITVNDTTGTGQGVRPEKILTHEAAGI